MGAQHERPDALQPPAAAPPLALAYGRPRLRRPDREWTARLPDVLRLGALASGSGPSGIAHRRRHFGKRDIFVMVVGRQGEAAGLPILLGLIDPVAAGRDEVPEDMARPVERSAATKHDSAAL